MTKRRTLAARAAKLTIDREGPTDLSATTTHHSSTSRIAGKAPPGLSPDLAALFEEMLASAPRFIDRSSAAKLVSTHLFKLSPRTIEPWPLPIRLLNGRANFETEIFLRLVFAKLVGAPVVMGGRLTPADKHVVP